MADGKLSQFEIVGYGTCLIVYTVNTIEMGSLGSILRCFAQFGVYRIGAAVYAGGNDLSGGVHGDIYHYSAFILYGVYGDR